VSRLSRVCREGQPGTSHPPCMACDCTCHHLRAPIGEDKRPSLREQYEKRVAELHPQAGEQHADGAA
jgi:hypothetical protein